MKNIILIEQETASYLKQFFKFNLKSILSIYLNNKIKSNTSNTSKVTNDVIS